MALKTALLACCFFTFSLCQTSTTTAQATTTLTVTESGACNNFVGACVVYGTGENTINAATSNTPASNTRATTTVTVSETQGTTGDVGSACAGFSGACVVYGAGGASTTVNGGEGNSETHSTGNGDGYIAATKGSEGYIGEGASISMGVIVPLVSFVLLNVGLFVML